MITNLRMELFEALVTTLLISDWLQWLVKSIIANYLDLGARVSRDIETERRQEEERRQEARRRIEERRRREEGEGESQEQEQVFSPPGFVPVDQLRAKWAEQDRAELPALPAAAEPLSVRR